ncbi:MAG: HAMP domain-containing histidine kinase [Rikenellaceae bacterium]|nr:HAMP domain-containing histidine kinase [Rikenellaceae bacterium]
MKIRNRIALSATAVTTAVFTVIVVMVMLFSSANRERQFYKTLYDETLTKANLYFSGKVDSGTMHEIYRNNRETIDEVEVAIYDEADRLVYHDDSDADIVKETPQMLSSIRSGGVSEFYSGKYQVVGLVYTHDGKEYTITAAAYDGYGISKLKALRVFLLSAFILALVLLYISGYYVAGKALSPVKDIVDEVEAITGSRLGKRLPVANAGDELGELSGAFNNMLDRLEKSFEAQSRFLSNISHELRTPLSALRAELEIAILKERLPGQYEQYIERALEDARNIEELSAGLLDLARAGSDSSRISMKQVRTDEILLDARSLIMRANPGFHVEIIFGQDNGEENWITVRGNAYLLSTAFANLIENNCKYSSDHHSTVTLTHHREFVHIRFSDTGPGIPKGELGRIFDVFYRGSSQGSAKGHGIGMTLAKTIIELHGGTIEVRSEQGEGTVFIVSLPHI